MSERTAEAMGIQASRRRSALVAGLGALLLAVLVGLFLWLTHDPLEAARQRVELGTDETAVTAAVGRKSDGVMGMPGRHGIASRRALIWQHGDKMLLVEFDDDDHAARAYTARWLNAPSLWDRLRAWWPW
jgi:hypothetical protein